MNNVNINDFEFTLDLLNTLDRLGLYLHMESTSQFMDLQSQLNHIKYRSYQAINDSMYIDYSRRKNKI